MAENPALLEKRWGHLWLSKSGRNYKMLKSQVRNLLQYNATLFET